MLEITYEEFRSSYKRYVPLWRSLLISVQRCDLYGLGFHLRCRVPDKEGFFCDVPGAQWCWPWQWYRKYYIARIG